MYEEFYNLKSDPFALSPSGDSAYEHSSYIKARSYMEYALHRGEGIVLVTGQPGTGKTTLIKELLRTLHGSDTVVLAFTCQGFNATELVSHLAQKLGLDAAGDELSGALSRIQKALRAHRNDGHRAVLVLDEAQGLTVGALEQARLLSNYQAGDQPLLQIVLVGQPELRDKILSPELVQLHQRIVSASDMRPLNVDEVREYFLHRMALAGWEGQPALDDDIFEHVFNGSTGIPRWINQIGSRLLLHGMLEEKQTLGSDEALSVLSDMINETLLPASARESQLTTAKDTDASSSSSAAYDTD